MFAEKMKVSGFRDLLLNTKWIIIIIKKKNYLSFHKQFVIAWNSVHSYTHTLRGKIPISIINHSQGHNNIFGTLDSAVRFCTQITSKIINFDSDTP